MKQANKLLFFGGILSGIAALLHITIIIGGPKWYRFFGFIPVYIVKPEIVDDFLIWSSLISLLFGFSYAIGTRQVWAKLSAN